MVGQEFQGKSAEVEGVKAIFARELCKRLVDHYGRMPSASVVSRDFNFRCPHLSPISQETARRWIRGLSVPEVERLATLVTWLSLRPDDIFRMSNRETGDGESAWPKRKGPEERGLQPYFQDLDPQLLDIWPNLNDKARQLLVMLARELQNSNVRASELTPHQANKPRTPD